MLYKQDWEEAQQRIVAWWEGELIDRAFDAWFEVARQQATDSGGRIDNIFGTPAQWPMLQRALRFVIAETMGVHLGDRPENNADLMEILDLERAADLRSLTPEEISRRLEVLAHSCTR